MWSPKEYAEVAVLAREVGEEMLSRLDWMTLQPKVILDAGCGIGGICEHLQARYGDAQVLAIDNAQPMLSYAKEQNAKPTYICSDAAKLPLQDQTVDLVLANFLLPWHADIKALLHEWRRVLRPNGLLMFTALGPDTLREWHALLDSSDEIPHLIDMHDIGDLLLQEKFSDPVLDVNHYTMVYRDKEKLAKELCASGMLVTQSRLSQHLSMSTPALEDTWQVTYEVVYAHAFMPIQQMDNTHSSDGVVSIPLSHLRRQLKTR